MASTHTDVQSLKTSFEEFLSDDTHTHAEWVQGEVLLMSPASDRHQNISGFLESILRIFVESNNLGIIRSAPFLMRINEHTAREPDLLFLSKEHQERLTSTYLNGPANLVIEIVSPESLTRDRDDKYFEYEQAGVPEYWLIDPIHQQAKFFQMKDGNYQAIQLQNNIYVSKTLPNFWLNETWLWQDPLPNILDILKQLKLV